jgi:bacillithiol system protein YtxJ
MLHQHARHAPGDEVRRQQPGCSGPVYQLDIIGHPELSGRVSTVLEVPHESPQVIVVSNGEAVWSDSHFGITEKAIAKGIELSR